MGLENFIPEVWAARLEHALVNALRYCQPGIINRNWEGEIQEKGDTVRIRTVGDVTVFDYGRDTDMGAPQALTSAQTTLRITQSKAFNFAVDAIDKAQADVNVMDSALMRAAYNLANLSDQFVANMYTDAQGVLGTDASPATLAAYSDAYERLVDLSVLLDQQNVPEDGRWVIAPPWFHGDLLKDDRFVKYGQAAQNDKLMNGEVGRAAGFHVLKSNNVPTTSGGTRWKIIAGHPMAWTYAEQVNKVVAYSPEKRFGDAVKGLHLYGGKVTHPDALAVCTVARLT